MQSWDRMLTEYDKSLAKIEGRIAELEKEIKGVPKNTDAWYNLTRRILWLEAEQTDLIYSIQQIRDRG